MSLLLVRVARQRDQAAFRQLLAHVAPRIKALLMRQGLAADQAEDVAQDVMVTLWAKAGLFDPERGTALAWIYSIARNARIERLRKERPHLFTHITDWDAFENAYGLAAPPAPTETIGGLAAAMRKLAVNQSEILEMAYVQGLSQSDMARKLGVPLGTLKSRMRAAQKNLRSLLEHDS